MADLIMFVKMKPCGESQSVVVRLSQMWEYLEDGEIGDKWIVEITKMSEEDFRSLPEFRGW